MRYLDGDKLCGDRYPLTEEQFRTIVQKFQYKSEKERKNGEALRIQQLAMNVMSIHTPKGLYVLAYKRLELDVKGRALLPEKEITICTEFTVDGVKESVRRYLDAEDYDLLRDFEKNQELIKDRITQYNWKQVKGVDDMPYVIGLGLDVSIDLHREYGAIIDMYQKNEVSVPLQAFFGNLLDRPVRTKSYPITLLDQKVNLDQLLAIHNAMKYPLAYIQGPPGSGKTNTIINTIVTAFFNEKTVLFTSYNNHPIDGVCDRLTSLTYRENVIPFPIVRLGNLEKVKEALSYMKNLYLKTRNIRVFEATLDRNKDDRVKRARELSALLKKYETILELKERGETMDRLTKFNSQAAASMQLLPFQTDVAGRQMQQLHQKIEKEGEVSEEEALSLLQEDSGEFRKYLYYTSVRFIKRLDEPKNEDLKNILLEQEGDKQVEAFQRFLSEDDKLRRFLRIFPIVATTCISAHKLGGPRQFFDMTIMDEASQCNTAVSLVPIFRGQNLMLVGDPQQLNPVIVLDETANQKLLKKYRVSEEYDYRRNSIYKTFLACDAVSDEVLLHYHYRCHRKIIDFNNKKYYNDKLKIQSESKEPQPLVFMDMADARTDYKNTAPAEAEEIVRFAALNRDRSIGVITPFVNQRKLIEECLEREGIANVTCGTVHAFQGDEKDVVLFSTAITDQTHASTYEWLKNNKELLNVATSRARDKLVVLASAKNLERLHKEDEEDDLYELVQYVRTNGQSNVTRKAAASRALGVKPFSTETEEAFLENLNHALENIWLSENRFSVHKEVVVSQVFQDNLSHDDLFYTGRFDFVVYEKSGRSEIPVLAIELDGKEHFEDEAVKRRDREKNAICRAHHLEVIRVENSYARRYHHIKEILMSYFRVAK